MNNNINLFYNFKYTFNLFIKNSKNYIIEYYSYIPINSLNAYINLLFIYLTLSIFVPTIITINYYIYSIVYWIFLGILSTIGFGFGLQTGIIFVIPYILNEYNNTQMDTHNLENLPSNSILFKLKIFLNTLPVVILWGIGSALGEIPPFILAKYNSNKEFILEQTKNNYFSKFFYLLDKYRFRSILIVSAWPNITFDMCGLMCGYYDFSLYDFLVPTIIGKSLIKSPLQSIFVIFVYSVSNEYLKTNDSNYYYITNIWNLGIFILFVYFIKKTIEKIASASINTNTINTNTINTNTINTNTINSIHISQK